MTNEGTLNISARQLWLSTILLLGNFGCAGSVAGDCGDACADDFICIAGKCVLPCLGHDDCAAAQRCLDGYCQAGVTPGDDNGGGDQRAGDQRGGDQAGGDSAIGDSAVGDSAIGDSAVGDSAIGDSAVGDSAIGDSAVGDTRTGDDLVGDIDSGGDSPGADGGDAGGDSAQSDSTPADTAVGDLGIVGPCVGQTDGTPCPDGIFCNGAEQCLGGVCAAGLPVSCSPPTSLCSEALSTCVCADIVECGIEELGSASENASGNAASFTLSGPVGVGEALVAVYAGRGSGPWSLTDSFGNTYNLAVGTTNSSSTESVAIFYATITAPLFAGDALTATAGSANNNLERTLTVFRLSAGASLDATGSSLTSTGTDPLVSTATAIGAGAGFVVAVTATGVCSGGATYTNDAAYTEAFTFTSSCSSGLVAYQLSSTLSGIQTFAPTASGGNAANCIATFR